MAQQTVLDPGVQLSDLVTLLAKGTSHPEIQDHAHTAHQRHAQKDHQCQRQIDICQNDKRDYGLDSGDEKFFWAMMGEFRHIKQIIGDPPHDLTDFSIVIISIGQLLQMVVCISAHVRLDLRAHDVSHIGHIVTGDAIHDTKSEIQNSQ